MTETLTVDRRGGAEPERHLFKLLGPAFVASIAYVDPGNVAANFSAGADYGYLLVWVLVVASAAAIIVQYLSAKLGIVTGLSLPEILGSRLSTKRRLLFWAQAEVTIAATEIAEVIGGALALHILFGLPLVAGGVVVFAVSMGILTVQSRRGQHAFELVVIGMLVVIAIGFLSGMVVAHFDWSEVVGGILPRFEGARSVLLAAGMVGATVMPHAIHVHSSLARDRHRPIGTETDPDSSPTVSQVRQLLRATRWDVGGALTIAGAVNIAMLLVAAASLRGSPGTDTIPGAVDGITSQLGPVVGLAFGVGLLASGLASTAVGGCAGSAVMAGLLHRHVPVTTRRVVTVIPALLILASGMDATNALVLSQVVLALGIPFALVPLAWFTAQPALMGQFANGRSLRLTSAVITTGIVVLNVVLLLLAVKG